MTNLRVLFSPILGTVVFSVACSSTGVVSGIPVGPMPPGTGVDGGRVVDGGGPVVAPSDDAGTTLCAPGVSRCAGGRYETCGPTGSSWRIVENCVANGKFCRATGCESLRVGTACETENGIFCVQDRTFICTASRLAEGEDCALRRRHCRAGQGCTGCDPGMVICEGEKVMTCRQAGDGFDQTEDCGHAQQVCDNGLCVTPDPCAPGNLKASNVGCSYWAVELENYRASAQFAVVVSNPGTVTADVVIQQSDNGVATRVVADASVPPLNLVSFPLGPRGVTGSMQGFKAFRVLSNQPVVAYQFSPLNNTGTPHTNDATLLLPTNTLDKLHYAVTWEGNSGSAFVVVVGTEDNTSVTLTIDGGMRRTTLQPFEVYSHAAVTVSLSGVKVESDKPVAVFSGNACASVSASAAFVCCCDHLEEQVLPVSRWGKAYVGAHSRERRQSPVEDDFWQVIGSVAGTALTYQPSRPLGAPLTLDAGQVVKFSSASSFTVEATEPILLTNFLASQEVGTGSPAVGITGKTGDPSMTLMPPIAQFRQSYVILIPADYKYDFVSVIAPASAVVTFDGVAVSAPFQAIGAIGGTTYGRYAITTSDGVHRIEATEPVGVIVMSYDDYASYGYVGGLNLARLNP